VDPYIDDDWEQNHSGLIIELEETENGLIGVFNIVMNEDISQVNIKKEPFSISKEFKFNTVFPNPFNNAIQIDFRINHPGYVSIGIYDLRGHWVTNLVEEMKTEGAHSINWEGLDLNGNPVASGLYIVVMKFSDLIKTKKIKLVK
jgi:flagellar hook assembly protein FlgD